MTDSPVNLGLNSLVVQHEATALGHWGQELREQAIQLRDQVLAQRRQFRTRLAHQLLGYYEHNVRRSGSRHTKPAKLELLAALHELEAILSEHISAAVEDCRTSNATWAQIGDALGVTRQAAHERYTAIH